MRIQLILISIFYLVCVRVQQGLSQHTWGQNGMNGNGVDIVTDDSGNVYSTGILWGGGSFMPSGEPIPNSGMYIAKHSPTGDLIWLNMGTPNALPEDLSIDSNGDIIVCGLYSGYLNLGGSSYYSVEGSIDVFIAKYSSNGDCEWAKSYGSNPPFNAPDDVINCIATDNNNSIYFSGFCLNGNTFQPFNIQGGNFIGKLSESGDLLWVKSLPFEIEILSAEVFNTENLWCVGALKGAVTFDGIHLEPSGYRDALVLSMNPATGEASWGQSFKFSTAQNVTEIANSVSVDSIGNATVSGTYSFRKSFILKIASNKNVLWIKTIPTSNAMTFIDRFDRLFIYGNYGNTISLDSHLVEGTDGDIFIGQCSSIDGSFLKVSTIKGPGINCITSLSVPFRNKGFVTGWFTEKTILLSRSDTIILSKTSDYYSDMFLADILIGDVPLSVEESSSEIRIFPNPSTGNFTITYGLNCIEHFNCYNMLGEKVAIKGTDSRSGTIQIQLPKVSSGVYFLEMTLNNKKSRHKLVID